MLVVACRQELDPYAIFSPEEAIADFDIEDGFDVSCVASEPTIEDPVAIAFDNDGAMYVVEMRTYMPTVDGLDEAKALSRIKVLEDKDHNGSYESMRIFLDSLVLPRAVCPVYDGVLVAVPPYLYFYDKSGKNKIIVDSTYAEGGNVEHQANGLLIGIDNWIYSARSDKRYQRREGKWITEKTVFRGQWGIDQDAYGRLYYHHNSAVAQGDAWQPSYLPHTALMWSDSIKKAFGKNLVDNKVYPRVTTYVNRGYEEKVLNAEGKLVSATGACGLTVYDGDQMPAMYQGNIFSPEPCGQLIKRVILSPSIDTISASLPYVGKEFLTASDARFRPVFTTTGPDGALYVVDMHRGLIQHSTYLTNYMRNIVKDKGLDKPIHMGRIYRITHKKGKTQKAIETIGHDVKALVNQLSHANEWQRIKAQWTLVAHADAKNVTNELHHVIAHNTNDHAKLHSAWTLQGINALTEDDINALLSSKNTELHKAAIHLSKYLSIEAYQKLTFPASRANTMVYLSCASSYLRSDYTAAKAMLIGLCHQYIADPTLSAILAGGIAEHTSKAQRMDLIKSLGKANGQIVKWLRSVDEKEVEGLKHLAHFTSSEKDFYHEGQGNYKNYCASCHGIDGKGLANIAPPLDQSEWVTHSDIAVPTSILLHGMRGPVTVSGQAYNFKTTMPGMKDNQTINDGTIAKILTYVRNAWSNRASPVHTADVSAIRSRPAMTLPDKIVEEKVQSTPPHKDNKPHSKIKLTRHDDALFNGKDLGNWHIVGGTATYVIKDNAIIGTTKLNTPNTFLVSNHAYADFELELDVWVDTLLNSGIQIRSNAYANYNNGAFHGYQIEIDPSARAWSGGLYDESRRGWLYKLEGKPIAQAAFKKNQWNHYKIRAVKDKIQTWINGIAVTDYSDPMTRSGYIGLQVHSIGNDTTKHNRQVMWRNISLRNLGNVIWQASEEDQNNSLMHTYDGDIRTSWQGQKLLLDRQESGKCVLEVEAANAIKVRYSSDGKRWTEVVMDTKQRTFPNCRLIELYSDHGPMTLHEVRIK